MLQKPSPAMREPGAWREPHRACSIDLIIPQPLPWAATDHPEAGSFTSEGASPVRIGDERVDLRQGDQPVIHHRVERLEGRPDVLLAIDGLDDHGAIL